MDCVTAPRSRRCLTTGPVSVHTSRLRRSAPTSTSPHILPPISREEFTEPMAALSLPRQLQQRKRLSPTGPILTLPTPSSSRMVTICPFFYSIPWFQLTQRPPSSTTSAVIVTARLSSLAVWRPSRRERSSSPPRPLSTRRSPTQSATRCSCPQ